MSLHLSLQQKLQALDDELYRLSHCAPLSEKTMLELMNIIREYHKLTGHEFYEQILKTFEMYGTKSPPDWEDHITRLKLLASKELNS
jgi:hypothetical protein